MLLDSTLEFVSHSSAPQTVVGAAGVDITFTGVIDLLGNGVGTPANSIIGNATIFGEDVGIGKNKPEIQITVGTAFTTSNASTANFAIEVARDDGTGNPDTWETAATIGALPAAAYTAGQVLRMAMPPSPVTVHRPRFIRLVAYILTATNMDAGTISFAGVIFARDDQQNRYAARNYAVA